MLKSLLLVLFLAHLFATADTLRVTEKPVDWELFQAIESGIDVAPLLNKGADVDAVSLLNVNSIRQGQSVWEFALSRAKPEVIAQLYKRHSSSKGMSPEAQMDIFTSLLGTTVGNNPNYQKERLELILKYGFDVNAIQLTESKRGYTTSGSYLSPLMYAAQMGKIDIIEILLKNGAKVNLVNRDGKSALFFAKNGDVVRVLQKNGASAEIKGKYDENAMRSAIMDGNLEVVKAILSGSPKPSKEILNQSLLAACRVSRQTSNQNAHSSSAEIAALLLKEGADPNYLPPGESRGRVLLEAVYTSNRPVVEVLLKAGAKPKLAANSNGGSLLALSLQQDDPEIVKLLWPFYQPMTDELSKEITLVSGSYGKPQSVAVLSALGFRLKKNSKEAAEALYRAVDKGEVSTVEEILKQGIDPNQVVYNFNLLAHAVQRKNLPVVTALVAHGAQVNTPVSAQEYMTPMSAAVGSGDLEILRFLLKKGGKLAPQKGSTPLIHFLPWMSYEREAKKREEFVSSVLEILSLLIKAGNKVDALDRQDQTFLAKMASQGFPELIQKLIEYGADVNFIPPSCKPSKAEPPPQRGKSTNSNVAERIAVSPEQMMRYTCLPPLSLAVSSDNVQVVRLLLRNKAKVNLASPFDGITPLMAAAQVGNPEVVEMLLKEGANPSLKNLAGQTASEIADKSENTRAKTLIDSMKKN